MPLPLLSLLYFFYTNPSALASTVTVPPFPISSPTTQEGLCSPATMAAASRRSCSSPSFSVFLPPTLPPPSSLTSPPSDLAVGPSSSPSLASSSLFADDHTTAPYSTFFCVFSTSVAIVAAVRHLPFPLLLRFPNATAPVCSLPHLLSFFSSAPLLTSLSTLATAVAAAVRPCLSSFSSFLYSATTDCRLCCRRRSHTSPPPSLFFPCRHRFIFRRSPPSTTLTSAPPDLVC